MAGIPAHEHGARATLPPHVGSGDGPYSVFDKGLQEGGIVLLRGRGGRGPRANGGRHGGCTPGATHRWVADASASGMTNSTTARIPTFARRIGRSATSMPAIMPTLGKAAAFAGS